MSIDDSFVSIKSNDVDVVNHLNVKYINSLYVHESILEWFENELLALYPVNNVIVEEIFHNKFDDNIKHVVSDRNTDHIVFDRIWMESKYKMRWLTNQTYFIEIDENSDFVLNRLEEDLTHYDLTKYIMNTYQMKVNWITIEEIKVFEFSIDLEDIQIHTIDQIFANSITSGKAIDKIQSLYLTVPLPWHNLEFDFIDMDTLAMDICAGEWKHFDLLDDLCIEDLLSLELANKDFRVPYYNDYLGRYIENVLAKKLTFSMEDEEKVEYSLPIFNNPNIAGYFIYKYNSKFLKLYTSQSASKVNFNYITILLKIPKFEFTYDKVLYLSDNEPDPINLVTRYKGIETIIYIINNYIHFTCELFFELMQLPNQNQLYEFDFMDGFNFEFDVPVCNNAVPQGISNINIALCNCGAEYEIKLCNFVRYLIKALKGYNCNVELSIVDCYLSDYTVFENVCGSFMKIEFIGMEVSQANLLSLASYLSKDNLLSFKSCYNISDSQIIALLQHSSLRPENLSIDTYDCCTPLLYYMLAEILMNRNNVKAVHMNEMIIVKDLEYKFNRKTLEFYLEDDAICLRNSETFEKIDLYYFLNDVPIDDVLPFEYT